MSLSELGEANLSYSGSSSSPLSFFSRTMSGNGNPLQYSCLENPMDGGAWWAAVHGVAKSGTWLSDFTFTFQFHALEKEIATHSSVLAWRIPGMGEPGGLPSILRPKFAKNLELGFLFCLVLFCLNQTTTSFKIFTRSNYSVPKHQTCTAHGPHGKAPSAGQKLLQSCPTLCDPMYISQWPPTAFAKLQGHLWASCFPHFSESFLKKKRKKTN